MELRVEPYKAPEQIFFNYEELKTELLQKVSVYETMVYGEDQIKEAKADRANLNRMKKALNDERIRREKEYMEPFNQFKAQIAEIISIIDKPVAVIDRQVKAAEEQQKQEKLEKIREFFERVNLNEFVQFEQILDQKWLNASVSMKSIEDAIIAKGNKIMEDLAVVRSLPSYAFEAEQAYLSSLDLAKAVSEAHGLQELAERKAAYEAEQAKKAEETITVHVKPVVQTPDGKDYPMGDIPVEVPARQWIGFQAFLSVDEAKALGQFMKDNGIKYKKG